MLVWPQQASSLTFIHIDGAGHEKFEWYPAQLLPFPGAKLLLLVMMASQLLRLLGKAGRKARRRIQWMSILLCLCWCCQSLINSMLVKAWWREGNCTRRCVRTTIFLVVLVLGFLVPYIGTWLNCTFKKVIGISHYFLERLSAPHAILRQQIGRYLTMWKAFSVCLFWIRKSTCQGTGGVLI